MRHLWKMDKRINILYEDNHLLVVEKPSNIPVMEDESKDEDLLTILKQDIKVRYNKPGEVYLGLVHRLDRPVGGVMVFAKTSKAASRLSAQVSSHELFQKEYHAVVTGFPKQKDTLVDELLKDHRTNTVKSVRKGTPNAKHAVLDYELIDSQNGLNLVKINLKTGRSHQIRVQFSSRNMALWGDQRYNKTAKPGQQIALWATKLTLIHPTTKEVMTFTSSLPDRTPFTTFRR